MQVSAADPKVPSWWNVFRSVCAPAPPEASDPAMVRATWVMAVFLRCRRWWTPRAPRNPAPTKMRFRRVGRPRAPRAWPPQRAGPARHSGPCHAPPGRPRGHPSSRHRPRAPRPRSRGRHDGRTTILLPRYSSVRVAARICDGPLRRRPPLLPPGQPSGPPSGPHAAARRGRTAADPAQRAFAAHREVPDRRRVVFGLDALLYNLLVFWHPSDGWAQGLMHSHPLTAKLLTIAAASCLTYLGNRLWTFGDRPRPDTARSIMLFVLIN